jgi:hypothetical protein
LQAFSSELYFWDYRNSNKLENWSFHGRLLGVDDTHNYRVQNYQYMPIKTSNVVFSTPEAYNLRQLSQYFFKIMMDATATSRTGVARVCPFSPVVSDAIMLA